MVLIKLVKKVATIVRRNDIIELYICDEELLEVTLTLFCGASRFDGDVNLDDIRAVQCHAITHSNLRTCIYFVSDKLP